ncbi:MAG: hypothetical protein JWO51_793 [Rhodospirillales bacterium]|nr:hypothetical protein [Rhodospirillales bacterium]
MRFLGVGDSCDLLALYRELVADGHEVKVGIENPLCYKTGQGIITRVEDWRDEIDWVRAAGRDGIILFENVAAGRGHEQDILRNAGLHVIGGSAYGDRLENDRAYAQSILGELGLQICRIHEFADGLNALCFIDEHPGRYVLKFNGQAFASCDNYVGRLTDGSDVRAVLAAKLAAAGQGKASFVLMEHVSGVEMGVGAYFNGHDFLAPACLDWEHKRFFPGDMGELTGEMGTVVTYERTAPFFERTLGRMAPLLRKNGYCGYINLNTIVNDQGIWPLEFTCRFGYPGYAILASLQVQGWAPLFASIIRKSATSFETYPGFSLGIVLTTPPFPYTREHVEEAVGLPVLVGAELSPVEKLHLHYGEVGLEADNLITSGMYGWTMVVTGRGDSIGIAKKSAYALAEKLYIPNMRYRADIGDRLIAGEFAFVEQLGLLGPT